MLSLSLALTKSSIAKQRLLSVDPSIQYWLDAADRLKSSSLKYTRVIPGFFMDYWGMPHAKTNLHPYIFGINIADGVAAIPGDGNDIICMTYTYDLAHYMVKLLELEDWPEFSVFVGAPVTYNEILAIAEDIKGKLEAKSLKGTLAKRLSTRQKVPHDIRQCRPNQCGQCDCSTYAQHCGITRGTEGNYSIGQSAHSGWSV